MDDPAAAAPPLLVYDGDCAFCVAAVGWLARAGCLRGVSPRPFQAFDAGAAKRLIEEGIRHEILLADPDLGRIRRGVDAIAALLVRRGQGRAARALAWPPLRGAAGLLYRTFARNRRFFAPPPRGRPPCACDPRPTGGDRLAAILLAPLIWPIVVYVRATASS